ncbi:HAD family hydrolase [Bombiscardovia coagulans]|uniref:Haloacid dehalogenase-like hydrolase n=1 Tax=Bombiscardovia coagulans TaxID=686666 RepID=A0A261ETG4_9BIFI|nr:HAD family phosphatase [Bombiscardovia coagulans]OZG50154.1 haloacid dehalogenase-like hydrolase [Bombiscardovia coagulans]
MANDYGKDSAILPKAVFWDMDGTIIDSEPYWHASEVEVARNHGGQWSEQLGWQFSGSPIIDAAKAMCARGADAPAERIAQEIIEGVARREQERIPWIEGVVELLESLQEAGVPSLLVTSSPRNVAQAVVEQAPQGVFMAYICGDDGLAMKPDPAPYIHAAALAGINPGDVAACVAIEDSITGLTSAAASGATTLAFTGSNPKDTSAGPQFASIDSYLGVTAQTLGAYVASRRSLTFTE